MGCRRLGSQEERSQDVLLHTAGAGPAAWGPRTGTAMKGIPERDAALRGGVPESNGDQDRESRPLTGAKIGTNSLSSQKGIIFHIEGKGSFAYKLGWKL